MSASHPSVMPLIPARPAQPPPLPALVSQGLQLHQAGKFAAAEALYRKSLSKQPNDTNTMYLLAKTTRASGRLEESATWFAKALTRDPKMAEWHRELGEVYRLQGKLPQAIDSYRQAVALRPEWFETWMNTGVALSALGRLPEAEPCFRVAVALSPQFVPALTNLGICLDKSGRLEEALQSFRQCAAISPTMAEAHNNIGVMLEKLGKSAEAIPSFHEAIRLKGVYPEAHNNLAVSLEHEHKFTEALPSVATAIEQAPNYAEAHNTQGSILYNLDRFDAAAASFRRAIELNPQYAEPINNLGLVQRDIGDVEGAERSHRAAITLQANYATAHFNLSYLLLLTGRFREGWEEYEWRTRCADFSMRSSASQAPPWTESVEQTIHSGKIVLLESEQGIGDTLQYVRFAYILAERGLRVIVGTVPQLASLVRRSHPSIQVITEGDKIPKFDLRAPMLTLGRKLDLGLDNIPAATPYLFADPPAVEHWRQRVAGDGPGFRVGLVWAGSPQHKRDRYRSCHLSDFAPLSGLAGVRWYSLQKGPPAQQLASPPAGIKIIDQTADLNTFDDTAALVANLDLVVSVDTSVAHLAGAMGKPVFMLLPKMPDWRWLLDRSDTPWYPSMRLFRSESLHDWSAVVQAVTAAVAEMQSRAPAG